ncbi:IgGFc-binding protein-like [Pseudopipra pipra]|uniref:IgGFc-binding protein-like n=1 Tax=Pseudopipra pipra TaxID=415032 RepID=UPI00313A4814
MDLGPNAVSIGSREFGSSESAMAWRGTWWLLLSFCALSSCSSGGREFLAVFPQNDDESPSATLKLLLTGQGPSDTATSVTLHGPFGTREVTVPPGVTKAVPIPAHLELTGSCMANKTVVVRASADVAVVAMSAKGYTVGATALLPMPSLGTRYYVVTPMGSDTYGMAELVVVAGAAITAVSITTTATFQYAGDTYVPGAVLRLFLQPYHSLQLQSSQDFTGTAVVANAPVAVLSGHTCTKVAAGYDFVVEQLLPTVAWGRSYVVPPNPVQPGTDLIYVVTEDCNTITYNSSSGEVTMAMAAGEARALVVNHNSPLHLTAVAAVQVLLFFTGSSWQDPFLLIVPPVTAHCTAFHLSTVPGYYNHAILIAPTTATAATTLNHQPAAAMKWHGVPSMEFSWAGITVSPQTRSAENPQAPMGLLVFGFESNTGYGFAGLCITAPEPVSCEDLMCEKCEVVDGQPKCVQETFSTCWLASGSHYRSFDGKTFDFMGTCTYTLTTLCSSDPTFPAFSVEVQKEKKENSKVSSIGSINVRIDNVTVTVVRAENGMVRVNNHSSRLPISLSCGKLRIRQKGKSVLIQLDFMLKVLYDWDDHVVVKIPTAFSGRVCGLCGNSNGNPRDDALAPDGSKVWDIVELGRSWKVTNGSGHCQDTCEGDCGRCGWDEEVIYKAERWCGVLSWHAGPFRRCHGTINPNVYVKNCIHDLCAHGGHRAVLCHALQAYADDCQENGIDISDWRMRMGCPFTCPPNSTYSTCGPTCPPTCNIPAVPSSCAASTTCVDSCVCHEGLVLDANICIPPSDCGCVFRGLFHGLGEEFWGDPTCTQRCVCDAEQRQAVCRNSSCGAEEECRVQEGIQDCYPKVFGVCSAVGATHYETFDSRRFIFQGTCVYLFVGLCEDNPNLVGFQVLVQNGRQGDRRLLAIAMVTVKVYNKTIGISREQPGKIMIDERLVNLPYLHGDKQIVVYRHGRDAVVETNFGLVVTYDWHSHVTVTVPGAFANALCGLCGNFNGAASDDMRMSNSNMASDPDAFGSSWKVADILGCTERSMAECSGATTAPRLQQEVSGMGCEIMLEKDGPFGACHGHVDAQPYFQSCIRDSCLVPEQEDGMCPIIASYASACQAAGVSIGRWRMDNFCSDIPCPPNSSYKLCSNTCQHSCGASSATCPGRCREGCACHDGFMLSGDECVPTAHCGCTHHGVYYKEDETFYPTEHEECRCLSSSAVECQNISCPDGSPGKVVDGIFQCPPPASGTCVATGDSAYITFDGVAFNVTGSCSYILSQTCTGDMTSFVVTIQKEARRKGKVSGIQALSVEVYGVNLTLTQGKGGDVMVNSISHHLPAILGEGQIQVYPHGTGVLLRTDFGLVVHYDLAQHVTLTVPQTYLGHLCGLCGNYNGQHDDDFHLSNGQLALDATAFGSTWKTKDRPCEDACPDKECSTCSKEKMLVLQKPNYCGLLTAPEGPFGSCHSVIDPTPYSQSCVHNLCVTGGDTGALCQSIQSYVSMCQDAGVAVGDWRTPSFCPLPCPANSTYSLCTNTCANTCAGRATTCPQTCAEGCQCHQGSVSDGQGCIPEEQCGCFEDGQYYKPHEVVFQDRCQRRCSCIPGQGLTCHDHSCTEDESCEIREGVLGCINKNPCKSLRCRPKERCRPRGSESRCVPALVATCWAWGDPHFRTFDGLEFDFQGTCTYTMAESHGNDPRLEPFRVEARNDIRGGIRSVSYVSVVNIDVYGQRVSFHHNEDGKVRVNGELALLPVFLVDGRLRVHPSGLRVTLDTDFGLRVSYDWNWHLFIDLPSSFFNHVRGLCGNFNLQPLDDIPEAGDNIPALVAWARGWRSSDPDAQDPLCWDHCDGECPVCEEKELWGGNSYCGIIKKSFQGPFRACHAVVKPQEFFGSCLAELCRSRGARQVLCRVLETYAATCRRSGATVGDWRTPAGCPLPCPENSHYEPCGTACPATCSDPDAPSSCALPCVESCVCDRGHMLSAGHCVPVSRCGCTRAGRYHRPGEEFWGDPSCRSWCRCDPELGMVVCEEARCKSGEVCAVVEGVRRCVATNRSICVATGDPHYTTFDGHRYDFMGTCVYLLAGLCSPDPTLVPFNVTVENNHRGNNRVSFTKVVTLEVFNVSLSLSQEHPKKVKVNGVLLDLPFSHPSHELRVSLRGVHGFISTAFGVTVTFDWHSYARVILPSTFAGAVCGLCGNANGDPHDDFVTRQGHPAHNDTHFGDSWKVSEVPGCSPGCTEGCQGCSNTQRRTYRGDKHCGILVKKRGPLATCHEVIDPAPFLEDCLFDTCLFEGHHDAVCQAVGAYVSTCQSRGVAVGPWRTHAFCSPVCPPNEHYELCGPPCPPTCQDESGPPSCPEPSPCSEGCFCDPGYFRSGDSCVPLSQCGCTLEGRYYPRGAQFYPSPSCTQRCVCSRGGHVECEPTPGCPPGQECGVRDGVLGCHPRSACGHCQLLGRGTYSTFGGQRGGFGGSCTLPLLEMDAGDPEEGPQPLRVALEQHEGEVRRVTVTAQGMTVAMDRGQRWEVMVDGERHVLPLWLGGGSLGVTQVGSHRLLHVRGGPKILYDGDSYAVLTLPPAQQPPRGLCGDPKILGTPPPNCTHADPAGTPPCPPGRCAVLADPSGPFGGCHRAVPPRAHLDTCELQVCAGGAGGGDPCPAFQGYAAACQAAGGELREWREETGCPLLCPPRSQYQLCARTCARTCAGVSAPPPCSGRCFEGCQCSEGLLFDGARCVPPGNCGCFHQGRYFQIAQTILTRDCSQSCTCRGPGGLQCRPFSCPLGHTCDLLNGTRTCVPRPGRCLLSSPTHFVTFDGLPGATLATGIYVVATVCDHQAPTWFRLLGVIGDIGDHPGVVALHLFTHHGLITARTDGRVWLNGVPTPLPAELSGKLNITESGGTLRIGWIPGFQVELGAQGVALEVTKDTRGTLCGLCGDYDGATTNDLRGPDGTVTGDTRELAQAWRAPDFSQ